MSVALAVFPFLRGLLKLDIISGLAVQTQCHYVSVLAVLTVSFRAFCQAVGCQTCGGVEVSVLSRNTLSGQSVNHLVSLLAVIAWLAAEHTFVACGTVLIFSLSVFDLKRTC